MNSPFANLFLAIMARIQANVPEIRYIDQDLGQFEVYSGGRPACSWPAVLLDVDGFEFDEAGELMQTGAGRVILRLGFPPYSGSSNLVPLAYREKGIAYLDIEYNLFKALHGWNPDDNDPDAKGGLTKLIRQSVSTEKRQEDVLRVRVMSFKIGIDDYIAANEYLAVKGEFSKKEYQAGEYNVGATLDIETRLT